MTNLDPRITIFQVQDGKLQPAEPDHEDATRTDGRTAHDGWYFLLDCPGYEDADGTGPFLGEEGAVMAAEVTLRRLTGEPEPEGKL